MNNGRKQTIIFLEVPENSRKIQVNLTSNTVFVRIFKIHKNTYNSSNSWKSSTSDHPVNCERSNRE